MNWLREWVDAPVDGDDLAEQLTLLGLEVDAVETAAPPFSGVVVGRIRAPSSRIAEAERPARVPGR
ncbi:MAG: hypothetical protein U5K43_01380 [Halofilum sp. (in: g-proteobacteria)]|nr:hypothetical protein [Halofilum sp. (in: g-proteobacteria)]